VKPTKKPVVQALGAQWIARPVPSHPMSEINDINRELIDEFRANDGQVGGMFAGWPVLLLTTTGAKSGLPRTHPVVYTVDGDRRVVIASKGGAPHHPHWYLNLVANPEVTVEVPGETYQARAEVPEGAERERLFRQQADLMPNFDDYAGKTDREIPVVVLEKIS
jgi:deazaflavin-dependent oxidoreductase (nitroreductase family)